MQTTFHHLELELKKKSRDRQYTVCPSSDLQSIIHAPLTRRRAFVQQLEMPNLTGTLNLQEVMKHSDSQLLIFKCCLFQIQMFPS